MLESANTLSKLSHSNCFNYFTFSEDKSKNIWAITKIEQKGE